MENFVYLYLTFFNVYNTVTLKGMFTCTHYNLKTEVSIYTNLCKKIIYIPYPSTDTTEIDNKTTVAYNYDNEHMKLSVTTKLMMIHLERH